MLRTMALLLSVYPTTQHRQCTALHHALLNVSKQGARVRLEVLTAERMSMVVCWIVTPWTCGWTRKFRRNILSPSSLRPEEGDRMFIRNAGINLQVQMALQPRRPPSTRNQGMDNT